MENPKPGSEEALAVGCQCPVIDNHYGNGRPGTEGTREWWVNSDCPVHGISK